MTPTTHALGQFLRSLPHSAAATFLALFPIVDPFGGIPIFFSMTLWPKTQDLPFSSESRKTRFALPALDRYMALYLKLA